MRRGGKGKRWALALLASLCVASLYIGVESPTVAAKQDSAAPSTAPAPSQSPTPDQDLRLKQTQDDVDSKSLGCQSCHTSTDSSTMHASSAVRIGCTDCHGGNATEQASPGLAPNSAEYQSIKKKAHPQPKVLANNISGNPVRVYTDWLKEDWDYVKFVNPGDLRVASMTCGAVGCHTSEVQKVRTSMMTHGAMLWGAALYNNGAFPLKNPHFGESYGPDGKPQRLVTFPAPTPEEIKTKGILPYLDPIQRWEISQPGNVLRIFERGGEKKPEIGIPSLEEEPGKPDVKLGQRGFGTLLRTDPVTIGLQKTRLLDPLLSFPGTNDQPGDYRNSGCTACHVVYANDNSPVHSAGYSVYGHSGFTATVDPTIPKDQPGHPIRHQFTKSIPSSQCMVCHMHPGTNMETTYFGFTWWDNEMDGEQMYPPVQKKLSPAEQLRIQDRNPERAAQKGLWGDEKFLEKLGSPEFEKTLKHTQFADFHSHGWVFRAVYKKDRQGNLLDEKNNVVPFDDPEKFGKAVHLQDIHLEKGMHCVDCHFSQDAHGNGKLYGETRNAVEIDCTDCHGQVNARAKLKTSGPASPQGGTDLSLLRTPWGEREFYHDGDRVFQRSMVDQGKQWEIVQVMDSVTPGNPNYNEKSAAAKTMQRDGTHWRGGDTSSLVHSNAKMTCYSCHSAWVPTCFGCHLQMTANQRVPMLHNEGLLTRNYTSYNFQILRDDIYMLGVDGTVTGNRIAPVRSACAVLVSSQNADRGWGYYQQQTVSAEGFSGQAFSPFVPHTVRAKETKTCADCHVSAKNDNNAWLAQVMLQGTGFMNFEGRYIYLATGKGGYKAVAVAEHEEPPTILGSDFHKIAYPQDYEKFVHGGSRLRESSGHAGTVLDLQARGEYLYAAMGKGGLRVFDTANVDDKDISQKTITAPVSPLGQRFYLKTKFAQAVASPTTLGVDPLRTHHPENEEQSIHLMYGFLYVADREEGLVIVGNPDLKAKTPGVGTLLDGDPNNNFLKRALAFNPDNALHGARRIAFVGTYAYVLCDRGLVVVDLDNPLAPKITAQIEAPVINDPRGIAVQFRYAFIVDHDGLKVLNITQPAAPVAVSNVKLAIADARNIYLARTYAYVSAGKQGIAIVNVEQPENPTLDQFFNAEGKLNDTNDVKIGMVSSSLFAFVADGKNGMQVVQLFSPQATPKFGGFSPQPVPKLIASYPTSQPALAVSRGIDRDRAVDETGHQLSVFGRRGSRPLNLTEMQSLYLKNGQLYTVTDDPAVTTGPSRESPAGTP